MKLESLTLKGSFRILSSDSLRYHWLMEQDEARTWNMDTDTDININWQFPETCYTAVL